MYPRTNYEMTEDDLKGLMDASKPTPAMMIGGTTGSTPQDNANRAWENLGKEMGFDHMTVRPVQGKGNRFFSAVPSETDQQRTERLSREAGEERMSEIVKLKSEIEEREARLNELNP